MDNKRSLWVRYSKVDEMGDDDCVTSFSVKPRTLAIVRSIMTLYSIVVLIIFLCDTLPLRWELFAPISPLGYYGITSYLLVSTILSWRYVLSQEQSKPFFGHEYLKFIYGLWYHFNLAISFFIMTNYFLKVYHNDFSNGPTYAHQFVYFSIHISNVLFMEIEKTLSKNKFYFRHSLITITVELLYVPYALVLRQIYDRWVYPSLNYEVQPTGIIIFIAEILVGGLINDIIARYVHRRRDRKGNQKVIEKQNLIDKSYPPISRV